MSKQSFKIAGKDYSSRLLVGTGKYEDEEIAVDAIKASGAEIVTVAVRRIELDSKKRADCILNYISPQKNLQFFQTQLDVLMQKMLSGLPN